MICEDPLVQGIGSSDLLSPFTTPPVERRLGIQTGEIISMIRG
jgi:hypothetical protein